MGIALVRSRCRKTYQSILARRWRLAGEVGGIPLLRALSENDDGSINVRWDDYGAAWDCSIVRQELIIEDKTVRKLRRKDAHAAASLKESSRTWTDASGQHKVEAKLVCRTEAMVTLQTDKGREINMPIEKLSDEDRKLLNSVPAAVENPFGPAD
jgi:hypothetical protein